MNDSSPFDPLCPPAERLPRDPWPRALSGEPPAGTFRAAPEEFQVIEHLPFEPEGEGNHLLLRVRKQGANTLHVAKDLARRAGCRPRDVGYAGLKDRHAVVHQHYTVPATGEAAEPAAWAGNGWQVEAVWRVRKKLKQGVLAGNAFRLFLRVAPEAREEVGRRFEALLGTGVPNYFGPQRFGREGGNLAGARRLFAGETVKDKKLRGLYLSAARSYLFNRVLATRVADGSWDRLLPGEYAMLAGTNSGFQVTDTAAEAPRLTSGDIHPSGPLPGTPAVGPTGAAAELEVRVLAAEGELVEGLQACRVEADRRALRVMPREGAWQMDPAGVWVMFFLPAGAFATAVVRELLTS
ncbi:MAG TPA: tRNA pseudouridine(13) synthase TruD [Gammaproteobacteria bacterium]|nr:tRNA pseudouridine(13) synthase TruD [Gammaproteobacteria bacterium]